MKIYIRTFGCQMNDRDSEALLGLFLSRGHKKAVSEDDADVILVNTCSVRDHAESRAISVTGALKKKKVKKIVGLIGCVAQNSGNEIFKKMHHISLICGPSSFAKIPAYIEKIKKDKKRIIDLNDGARDEKLYEAAFRIEPNHAQVIISTGCSNFCSYCVVPYVRGKLLLRRPKDIIDEVKRNIDLGITKITLLGQNVNDYKYHNPDVNFVDLLGMVENTEGLKELTFITSQPRNTTKELFTFMAKSSKIKKNLHLPFQSGSDRILKLMKRGYDIEKYLKLVDSYKKIVGGTLSTDAIVGFPTETDGDFKQTRSVLENIRFKTAYIFKYSPRSRAKSSAMEDDVGTEIKKKRHKILLDLQIGISTKK